MLYLSDQQLADRYQVSRNTIWRWTREKDFPKPVKLYGSTRWLFPEINEWEQTR